MRILAKDSVIYLNVWLVGSIRGRWRLTGSVGQAKKISPGAVLLTVGMAQFVAPMMLTAVSVALPAIGRDFGASAMQLGLVEQIYTLSLAMNMLTFGRLGDLVGRIKVFFAGLVIFTLMTASIGFTQSIHMLLAQRFVQGIGASLMLAGSMALVASVYPPEVRGRKIGLVSAFTYAGLSVGPVLGGYVTDHLGWRYVFWLVVPVGVSACILCIARMRGDWKDASGEKMDWRGSFVYAVGIACVMLGASHVGGGGSGHWAVLAGLVLLFLFTWLESRVTNPLLDVTLLFSNRFFTMSCLAAVGSYASTFGVAFFMSLYLQYAMGFSARHAGFVLLLQPLTQVAISPLVGRLTDRFEPGRLANIGIAIVCASLSLMATTIGPHAPLYWTVIGLFTIGIGFGVFITPNTVSIMGSVERHQFGVASGLIATMRTLGMVTSMTTITLIFSLLMGGQPVTLDSLPEFLTSMRLALVSFALFSCVGVILSLGRGRKQKNPKTAL